MVNNIVILCKITFLRRPPVQLGRSKKTPSAILFFFSFKNTRWVCWISESDERYVDVVSGLK